MAAKSEGSDSGQSPVDLVRELMRILDGTSIAELEVEHGGVTVYIEREASAAAAPSEMPTPDSAQAGDNVDGREPDESVVTASYVGEFRREDVPAVGDEVTAGTKLGEIEVLGIRNAVLASADGVLLALLVEDEAPVEYGQPLAIIKVRGKAPEPPESALRPA